MTEYDNFIASNMKNMCRTCLRAPKDVCPMTPFEINAYLKLTEKNPDMSWLMNICMVCKWVLTKCMKFMEQCNRANEMLLHRVDMMNVTKLLPTLDLNNSPTQVHYLGPEHISDEIDTHSIKNDYTLDDDEDDVPLVMFQTDFKEDWSDNQESLLDTELKQEQPIKDENTKYIIDKKKRKKKNRKECQLKEGFSSRMVQETEEYYVIKLTSKQVLSEMSDKSKAEAYIRSPFKCEKCVKGFNFEDVLQKHMIKHSKENGSYKCEICEQYCPNTVSLRGHLKSHTTRYKCKLCGVIRLSRQHLLEHHSITHTSAPITYSCDKCEFTTNKRTVIQRHVKTHVNSRHCCIHCGKLFTSVETLRVHNMRHDKSKRLQCSLCDKSFIYQSLLHKHIKAVHESKEYYCVECDVTFKTPESMKLHFKKAKRHRDPSSFKHSCPQCLKRFVSSASLSVHLTTIHGVPKQHSCDICNRLYSSKEALRSHQWRSHSKKEELTCHLCNSTFNRKSAIRTHMRSHFGQKTTKSLRTDKQKEQNGDNFTEVAMVPTES